MFWSADRIYSQGIEQAQQRVYEFFLQMVRRKSPEEALVSFEDLFVNLSSIANPEICRALDQIITAYNAKEFFCTLKRCCYILINNWTVTNNRDCIQSLINIFDRPSIHKKPTSLKLKTLRVWLQLFIESDDFQSLKLFALANGDGSNGEKNWGDRFASYLLAYQYTNPASPLEQRQAAILLSQKMKSQFRLDLAMYTARLGARPSHQKQQPNPTSLSENVINVVTLMLSKKSVLNCKDSANAFLKDVECLSYQEFKVGLLKYLDFSITDAEISGTVQAKLSQGLFEFKANRHDYPVTTALVIKTAKYLLGEITFSDREQPTELFNILLHHTSPINLVVLLLKLLLLNESVRPHLELRIAALVKYYSQYNESKCKSVIAFIDMLNIALTIYVSDTRYNIVRMVPSKAATSDDDTQSDLQVSRFDHREYRIFSQACKYGRD